MPASSSTLAWRVGRSLLLLAALVYGVLPGIIDLFTPQHLGDPNWIGHPRFHLIWQIFLVLYLGGRGLWFAWHATSPERYDLARRSAAQGAVVLAAFFTAGALAVPMGAAYGAPDDVILGIPFPVVHFTIAGIILLSGFLLCRRAHLGARATA